VAEVWSQLLGFALTLWLHAGVLLGMVWLLERGGGLRDPVRAEAAWRGALFGAVLTATISSAAPAMLQRIAGEVPPAPVATMRATYATPPPSDFGQASASSSPTTIPPRAELAAMPAAMPRPHADAGAPSVAAMTDTRGSTMPASGPASTRATVALPSSLVRGLAMAWLAATLAWLLLTAQRLGALHRLRRAARTWPAAAEAQQAQARALCTRLGLSAVALHRAAGLASPVVLPDRRVLLPAWSETIPRAESEALLAHELAHLARRDPRWRIAQHVAFAPLCLNPLAWLALRRLDALAERGADALAARALGDGRALAECLARCLAQQLARPASAPRFALAMAERPGAVVDRVQHLLEDDPMRHDPRSPRRTRLVIALGLLAALSLPTIAVTAFADSLFTGQSISVHVDDDGKETVDIAIRAKDYALEVEIDGKVEFAPDESDVTGMAPDAELAIEETRDGVTRRLVVTPADRGTSRDYRVDGEARDFDAAGRAWLAQVLPDIFRSTGIDAEARTRRILAQHGSDGLLAEIDRIRTEHGRARYLGLLFEHAALDVSQMSRALDQLRGIESDYELRQAITRALDARKLDAAQELQVLDLVQAIASDYERAELLVATASRLTLDPAAFAHWARGLDGIGSDYERRRALEALLQRDRDQAAAVRLAFEAARGIGSDYEKRQLLEQGLAAAQADPALRELYLSVAAGIGSDYECKEALLALLRGATPDAGFALALLDAIDGIGSGHERSEALVELAARMPADAAVIERYRASARRLSTHERGKAEAALDRLVVVR
jgi:beta-lactamase regulating signal transducer with metallopeptidase domain